MNKEPKPKVTPVSVMVDSNTGEITCLPNPVKVAKQGGLISFTMSTPGYAFRNKDAIIVDLPDPDFPFPSWTINAVTATILDLNNTKASFEYSVYVVDTATGDEISVDPIIENGGVNIHDGDGDDC